MNLRKIMYVVIVIVCIWSIAIGVYDQYNSKFNKQTGTENVVPNGTVQKAEENKQDQKSLKKEFEKIFTNEIIIGQYDTSSIKKKNEDEEILYTYSAQRKTDNYELDINFPIINIESDVAKKIDTESKNIFINKANNIIQEGTQQTIYNVSYIAYINGDILSIIIRSTLKEGSNAQRLMIQTYNINLTTGAEATFSELTDIRQVDKDLVSTEINSVITQAIKDANVIQETGYEVYSRDLSNNIYKVNSLDTFFLDKDGALCVIFAYGNYDFTSELDIVKI